MESNVFLGVALHAIGGIVASTCFVPQKGSQRWSYQSFWLLMCLVSWVVVPIIFATLTIPDLMGVIKSTDKDVLIKVTGLGAIYGFGGMAFGLAIRYIGFSLTYAVAIGLSAILGTIATPLLEGKLAETFDKPGGNMLVIAGICALVGIAICGFAGKLKEKELADGTGFNLKVGLPLVLLAGILSAVFGMALDAGASMDKLAEERGAGQFVSGAKYIFAMGGAFITNIIWWGFIHFKNKTWGEYASVKPPEAGKPAKGNTLSHWLFASLAGLLWYGQFLFYGMGHTHMGNYGFISWGVHMAMLVFFSFIIGILLKEWKGLSAKTMRTLTIGLIILVGSFGLIILGSYQGQQEIGKTESTGH